MAKAKKSNFGEKIRIIFGHILVAIAILIVISVFGGAYYLVIAPRLVIKPFVEKPVLPEGYLDRIKVGEEVIKSEHINYIINEIGAYKLHEPLGTRNVPIIEFVITDVNEGYYTYVKDNKPTTKKGNPKNEDIIIKGNQETILYILKSDNLLETIKKAKNEGKIQVELKADMQTLAMKGYLSLYDALK